jgi:hypothetical protein
VSSSSSHAASLSDVHESYFHCVNMCSPHDVTHKRRGAESKVCKKFGKKELKIHSDLTSVSPARFSG